MRDFRRHPMFWRRHTASVPKGYLREKVLRLLNESPLSGSEIMEKIKSETDGQYKPSPGSIYPLLSLLQDHGYVKELPIDESGKKRYEITEEGGKSIEELEKIREKDIEGPPLFFSPMWFNHFRSKIDKEVKLGLRKSVRTLFSSLLELRKSLSEKFTEESLQEADKFINETAERIRDFAKKLKE